MGQVTRILVGLAVEGVVTKRIQGGLAWNTVIHSKYLLYIFLERFTKLRSYLGCSCSG